MKKSIVAIAVVTVILLTGCSPSSETAGNTKPATAGDIPFDKYMELREQDLKAVFNGVGTQLKPVHEKLDNLDGQVSGLSTRVTELEGKVDATQRGQARSNSLTTQMLQRCEELSKEAKKSSDALGLAPFDMPDLGGMSPEEIEEATSLYLLRLQSQEKISEASESFRQKRLRRELIPASPRPEEAKETARLLRQMKAVEERLDRLEKGQKEVLDSLGTLPPGKLMDIIKAHSLELDSIRSTLNIMKNKDVDSEAAARIDVLEEYARQLETWGNKMVALYNQLVEDRKPCSSDSRGYYYPLRAPATVFRPRG